MVEQMLVLPNQKLHVFEHTAKGVVYVKLTKLAFVYWILQWFRKINQYILNLRLETCAWILFVCMLSNQVSIESPIVKL